MTMGKISVIILCHNNPHIDRVIGAVKEQTAPTDEIFVVDDHSSDGIRALLGACGGITIITPEKCGNRAHNRNCAALRATGEILVFLDGDVLPEAGAVGRIKNYPFEGVSGLCGNVAAMQVTPEEADIVSKNFAPSPVRVPLSDPDLLFRLFPDSRKGMTHLPWNRFYSALCAVPKDAFVRAGLFDERLSDWGGEDIDLGYRLSFLGDLRFDEQIRGVHIPHPRDRFREEKTNRKNMYAMLAKYRNRDMEELLSFACEKRAHDALDRVLSKMRETKDPVPRRAVQENELCLFPVSSTDPDGRIAYISDGKPVEEHFLGLALPFEDLRFGLSRTDTRIFGYPIGMATRIMQELLRVSPKLVIGKADFPAVDWGETENSFRYLFCYYKTIQFCDSYSDFDITDEGSRYVVTLAKRV